MLQDHSGDRGDERLNGDDSIRDAVNSSRNQKAKNTAVGDPNQRMPDEGGPHLEDDD